MSEERRTDVTDATSTHPDVSVYMYTRIKVTQYKSNQKAGEDEREGRTERTADLRGAYRAPPLANRNQSQQL